MNWFDVLILIFCIAIVIYVIIKAVLDKKKGKNSCCCNCSTCKNSGCKTKKTDEKH